MAEIHHHDLHTEHRGVKGPPEGLGLQGILGGNKQEEQVVVTQSFHLTVCVVADHLG